MDNALLCQRGNADGTALVVIPVSHFRLCLTVSAAASVHTSHLAVQKPCETEGWKRKKKYHIREAGTEVPLFSMPCA